MLKKIFTVIGVVAVMSGIGTVPANANASAVESTTVATQQLQGLTSSQSNAVRMAKQYLQTMPFSRSGLIQQLTFEGFRTRTATFAVDYITVSWKNQAYKMARQYLRTMPFSLSGLIEQLAFEGFTPAQARYGANRAL